MQHKNREQNGMSSREEQEFIRLLREKAADTPIPMAMEPEMMMARLEPRRRFSWVKVLSPVALAVTACFALVLAGRDWIQQPLNASIPATESSVTAVEPESEPASSGEESGESAVSTPVPESSESAGESSSVVSSEENTEVTSPSVETNEPVSEPAVSLPEQGNDISQPEEPESDSTEEPEEPAETGYEQAYEAIQRSVDPQVSDNRYETGVLSAGISADGLHTSNEKSIITAYQDYFYISRQNSSYIAIVQGGADGEKKGTFQVTFETPEIEGAVPGKPAITGCEVVNGRLFVAGTISYSRDGSHFRTVSAVTTYDLEDPTNPKLMTTTAQDGVMVGLKQVDSYLYLFSRYYPNSSAAAEDVDDYVPHRYINGETFLVPAEDIRFSEGGNGTYIVATAYNSKNPWDVEDSLSLQGGGKSFYLGEQGLYLFGEEYESGQVVTRISALNFDGGQFTLAREATVPGILNRSNSPNEYGGTLRILTNTYSVTNDTNLYIFDRQLNLLGSATQLVENQILRSVWFERNLLYFTLYGDSDITYGLDLTYPTHLGRPYRASRSEESLSSISLSNDRSLKLSGSLGRNALTLQLDDGRSHAAETIELTGTYDESTISLQAFPNGYVALYYSDSGDYTQSVRLYRIGISGELTQVLHYQCSIWKGTLRCYQQDGEFHIVSLAETVSYNMETGERLRVITY